MAILEIISGLICELDSFCLQSWNSIEYLLDPEAQENSK